VEGRGGGRGGARGVARAGAADLHPPEAQPRTSMAAAGGDIVWQRCAATAGGNIAWYLRLTAACGRRRDVGMGGRRYGGGPRTCIHRRRCHGRLWWQRVATSCGDGVRRWHVATSRGGCVWRQRAVGGGTWERVDAVTTVAPGPAPTGGAATGVCGDSVWRHRVVAVCGGGMWQRDGGHPHERGGCGCVAQQAQSHRHPPERVAGRVCYAGTRVRVGGGAVQTQGPRGRQGGGGTTGVYSGPRTRGGATHTACALHAIGPAQYKSLKMFE
jgi:hypothetical protein